MRLRHVVLMACVLFCWIWALPLLCLGVILATPFCLAFVVVCILVSCYLQWRDETVVCGNHWLRQWVARIPWHEWFPCNTIPIPNTPHVVCVHPHGVLCCGALAGIHFVPGNRTILCVAPALFFIPVFGWCIRLLGCIPARRDIMSQALDEGYSVLIVPGGVPEMVMAERGKDNLMFLKQRFGFVKLAIQHQVPLLPVFVRGETALFRMCEWPWLAWRVRLSWWLNIPVTLPLFGGHYGTWIPQRKPLTLIVGQAVVTKSVPLRICKRKYMRHLIVIANTIKTINVSGVL